MYPNLVIHYWRNGADRSDRPGPGADRPDRPGPGADQPDRPGPGAGPEVVQVGRSVGQSVSRSVGLANIRVFSNVL